MSGGTAWETGLSIAWSLHQAANPVDAAINAAEDALRSDGPAAAEAIIANALAARPDELRLLNARGVLLHQLGRNEEALPFLRPAAAALGDRESSYWTYTTALALTGRFDELLALAPEMDRLAAAGRYTPGYYRHLALAKLSMAHDRAACLTAIRALQHSPRWLDAPALLAHLRSAIAARAPFSFIRMGDGEARLQCYLDAGVRRMLRPPELVAMLDSVWFNWFAESVEAFDPVDTALLGAELDAAVATADVLGFPSDGLIETDHYHFGFFAVMQAKLLAANAPKATPALVHNALHQHDRFLGSLLRGLDFLGVVSCHGDLAARLAAVHGIGETQSYVVPGENGRTQLPAALRVRGHFPEAYRRTLDALTVPAPGAVFLVGAGVLGKIYCARIKALGGIALDIGSLADAWLGFNTRPGQYDHLDDWRLPAT